MKKLMFAAAIAASAAAFAVPINAVSFENGGKDCIGNGEHVDETGELIECMCDECDYLAVCVKEKTYEGLIKP